MPSAGEFGDEFFEIAEFAHGEAQEGDAGGGEEVVHEHVAVFAVGALVTVVIQLDAEHGHPVVISADQEIDVLLADHLEGTVGLFVLKHIRQTRFDLNATAGVGDLGKAVVETLFRVGEQRLGGVLVGQADADFGIGGNELHKRE